jgi:Predicted HD superfamily hydrolase
LHGCIEDIENDVRVLFAFTDKAHDFSHTKRVLETSIMLQKQIDTDEEIVQIIALLHDVDDKKLFSAKNGEANARYLLNKHGYPDAMQKQILSGIHEISFSGGCIGSTEEAKIVQDADRLDAIGAIGIARTFTYGGSKSIPIYDANGNCIIDHFYDKLLKLETLMNFDISREMAKKRTACMRCFLEQFFAELSNNT